MGRLLATFAVLILAFVFGAGDVSAHHGGERHPSGYGKDVCITANHDLAVDRRAIDEDTRQFLLHTVGCYVSAEGRVYYRPGFECMKLAYDHAKAIMQKHRRAGAKGPLFRMIDYYRVSVLTKRDGCLYFEDGSYARQ